MKKFDLDRLLNDLGVSGRKASTDSQDDAPSAADSVQVEGAAAGDTGESGVEMPIAESDTPATVISSEDSGVDGVEGEGMALDSSEDATMSNAGSETDTDSLTPMQEMGATEQSGGSTANPKISASQRMRPFDALTALWEPPADADSQVESDLGEALLSRGVIEGHQLNSARTVLKQTPGKTLTVVLLEMGVDEEAVQRVVAELNSLPFERIDPNTGVHVTSASGLGHDFCKHHKLVPLRKEGGRLFVGTAEPDTVFLLDEVRRRLGVASVKQVLVTATDINLAMELQQEDEAEEFAVDDILADIVEGDVEVVESTADDMDFEKQAGESPVIRYVNYIIQTAMKDGASDIHIEPGEKKLKVRFRIDGVLFESMNPPHRMHAAIVSRLKIMANLDISERRLPQDGRIRAVVANRKLDLRVSTLPTVAGEKCVIRILDNRSISVGLDQLGFDENTLTIWQRQIAQPHGIILVTGPTGSGKTTTLYSSLREMDTQRLNISTVEDPVEYHLENISQVQILDKIGMSFAAALRSLLRQDPDVVMLGEIRDGETARIAVQAALTGHLVLSTLHTNDAPSSVTRLINIGVEPFLIGGALNAVLAQRLVRRICSACRTKEEANEEVTDFLMMQGLEGSEIYTGTGCDRCRETGYSGRSGIYELLVLDDVTRDAIARSPNVTEFRRMCIERGMVTLRQDGMLKVAKGETTVQEILRVTEATI